LKLIVNADDFGLNSEINRAILAAHRDGILTSASLIAGGAAVEEAVDMARHNPRLAVGLHIVAIDGPAVLAPGRIPHIVDDRGRFSAQPFKVGLMYAFSAAARSELRMELRAQFERFAATGLKLSHVDGHQHMHLHPAVLEMVLPLAKEFSAAGVRVPRDDLSLSLRADRRKATTKMAWTLVFGLLSRWAAAKLRSSGLVWAARTYGFMQTGQMLVPYVLAALRHMRAATAEMYFHPTTGARADYFGPNPGDLHAMLSAAVRREINRRGIELATYKSLAGGRAAS